MNTPGDAYRMLSANREATDARDRHLEFFRTFARQARDHEDSWDRDAWADLLEAELDNVRAALAWSIEQGHVDAAQDLASSCKPVWERGRYTEGRMWLSRSLSMGGSTEERLRALLASAELVDPVARGEIVDEAVDLARALADDALLAAALCTLGWDRFNRALNDEAVRALEEAVAVGREVPSAAADVADALRGLASILAETSGQVDDARKLHEDGLRLLSAEGFEGARCRHLGLHGAMLFDLGDMVRAERVYEQKLTLEQDPRLARTRPDTLLNLADVKQARGNRDEARALWGEVLRLAGNGGIEGDALRANVRLAGLDLLEADLEAAASRLDLAMAIAQRSDDAVDLYPNNLPLILFLQAELAEHRGDLMTAQRLLEQRVALRTRPAQRAVALLPLARLAFRTGDAPRAVRLIREALDAMGLEPALESRFSVFFRSVLAEYEDDLELAWGLRLQAHEDRHRGALPVNVVMVTQGLVQLAVRRRDAATARSLVAEVLPLARSLFMSDEVGLLLLDAQAALLEGDFLGAADTLAPVLPRWPEVGGAGAWVQLVETLARIRVGTGLFERGAELLGLAEGERARIVYPRRSGEEEAISLAGATVEAALGGAAFEAAKARGRAMDVRQALWADAGR